MKRICARILLICSCFLFLVPAVIAGELEEQSLSKDDYTALKICEGVIQLFKQFPDSIWPGYDLAIRPFIFYMPEKAFLFNCQEEVEGFTKCPMSWPDLGTVVQVHQGQFRDLVGQLGFGLTIDTVDLAAVPFVDKSNLELFGFIVHENFHQYQQYGEHPAFGEIPWEREERYPICDRENTSLAYLEMRLLMDALKMMEIGNRKKCCEYIRQFVAVRDYRWKHSDPLVRGYEQGEEINEGTAKYVEVKAVSLVPELKFASSLHGLTTPLSEDFDSLSLFSYLRHDFQSRISGGTVSPMDVGRYRIYPVGAAQGVLLDYLKIDWKDEAQKAGPEFTYAQLFKDNLKVSADQLEELLGKAKKHYDYERVLVSTDSLVQEYMDGYKEHLAEFEAQKGYRVEIDLVSKNLSRSSTSSAMTWIIDRGREFLRSHYDVYVLKSVLDADLFLEVHNAGLFEDNDWDKKTKRIVFFIPQVKSILLDGKPIELLENDEHEFGNIELIGEDLQFNYRKAGIVTLEQNKIKINIMPSGL